MNSGDAMKISTADEFKEQAAGLLRSKTPVIVTRRGRMRGIFLPYSGSRLPDDLRAHLFDQATSAISSQMKENGISEEEILADFEKWRKRRRATRRRR
jgi:hypothetical protein